MPLVEDMSQCNEDDTKERIRRALGTEPWAAAVLYARFRERMCEAVERNEPFVLCVFGSSASLLEWLERGECRAPIHLQSHSRKSLDACMPRQQYAQTRRQCAETPRALCVLLASRDAHLVTHAATCLRTDMPFDSAPLLARYAQHARLQIAK